MGASRSNICALQSPRVAWSAFLVAPLNLKEDNSLGRYVPRAGDSLAHPEPQRPERPPVLTKSMGPSTWVFDTAV